MTNPIKDAFSTYMKLLHNLKPLHELDPIAQSVVIQAAISGSTTLYVQKRGAFEPAKNCVLDPLAIYRVNVSFVNYMVKAKCPLCNEPCVVHQQSMYAWQCYCSECTYCVFGENLDITMGLHTEIWNRIHGNTNK